MKRYATAIAAILISCGFATVGMAQTMSPANAPQSKPEIVTEPGNENLNLNELKAFDEIAKSHPDMAKSIARKPALIKSDNFVSKYPELQEYLSKYPDAREKIHDNPGDYVEPVAESSWKHALPGLKASAEDGSGESDGHKMKHHAKATEDGGGMKDEGGAESGGSMAEPSNN
jgi:hypothetical protein